MASTKKADAIDESVIADEVTPVIAEIKATNAVRSAKITADQQLREATMRTKKLGTIYMHEKKVSVTISPFYAPYIGRTANITVNGIAVYVPADGRAYSIPESHAASLRKKLKNIDKIVARGKALGNVANNVERFVGELKMF